MFIMSIHLKNFRCYKDQRIDFDPYPKRVLDLVIGDAGAGKTSLFNAIGWCLFGDETSTLLREPEQDLGIPNVDSAQSDVPYEVFVELTIGGVGENGDGQIIAKRTAKYEGKNMLSAGFNGNFWLAVAENSDKVASYEGNEAESKLKEFFNREFLEFYMFDGEYLAKGENIKGNNLDHAFRRMFKIGALKGLSQNIGNLSSEYGRKRGNSGKLRQLQEEYSNEDKHLEQMKSEKEELGKEIDQINRDIQNSNNYLESLKGTITGIEMVKKKISELNGARTLLETAKKEVDETRKAYRQSIINGAYLELLKSVARNAASAVHEESRGLPPYVKVPFLEDIIEKHICICGRPLQEESQELEKVKELRDAQNSEPYEAQMSELATVLSKIAGDNGPGKEIENSFKMLDAKIKEKDNYEGQKNNMENESSELSKEQEDTFRKYNSEKDKSRIFNDSLKMKIERQSSLEKKIGDAQKNKDEIDSKINKQASKNKEVELAERQKKIADIAKEVVDEVASKLSSVFISLLEEKFNDIIKDFQILSGITASIRIGESKELSVSIVDSFLDPDRSYLSGGQNQEINILLIVAFTQALSDVSLSVPFIVMDHPFSNLSKDRKIEAIEKFRDLFKDTRILMLIPPGDFDISGQREIIGSAWRVSNCKENKECEAKKEVL